MTKNSRALQALLRTDASAFIEKCFRELNPGAQFLPHWSIDLIVSRLEAWLRGESRLLIINLPPRHLKSIIASVAFPALILGRDPTAEILCASYAQDLSEKFSRDTRTIMTSPWYQRAFATRLSATRQAAADFETTMHGFRKATSVGGVITGRGADFIIIDDPMKPEEAMSKTQRESTNDWFSHTLFSRLNDKAVGRIVIVMQRLHENDLTGHLLEAGGWEVLNLPAIAQEEEVHTIRNLYGLERVERKMGDALHPAHESLDTLAAIRRSVGSAVFSAQYLQAPTPPGGLMVKPEWFKRYQPNDLPNSFDVIVMSCDTANKATELADYTAMTVWGVRDGRIYLLHVLRRKVNYPDLKRLVLETATAFAVTNILIEDRASGTQLIQELKSEGFSSVEGVEPCGDKVMRLYSQTATIENGLVHLPEEAPWLFDYLSEITSFPISKHDDQVDSTSQALAWIKRPDSAREWINYYRMLKEEQDGVSGFNVRVRVPDGVSHVQTARGRNVYVPNDRVVVLSEAEAMPLIGRGWTRL